MRFTRRRAVQMLAAAPVAGLAVRGGGAVAFQDASPAASPAASPVASPAVSPVASLMASPVALNYMGSLNWYQFGYTPGGGTVASRLADEAVAAFQQTYPGVTVNIVGVPFEGGQQTLDTALAAGGNDAPDVFRIASDRLIKYVDEGLAAAIDPYMSEADQADIYPNVLAGVEVEGQHYAWPLWVPPVGVYLNPEIFAEKGVELPGDDWTFDQFRQAAQQLTFQRADGTQVFGFASAIQPDIINVWAFLYADGGRVLTEDGSEYTFDSPEAVSGLQKLTDLALTDKVTPPEFGNQMLADIVAAFKDQRSLAMYLGASGDIGTYRAENVPFEVRPMPIGATGEHVTVGGLGTFAVRQQDDADRLAAAMAFARFLTSPEAAAAVPGYFLAPPARRSIPIAEDNRAMQKFGEMVAFTQLMPQTPVWGQVSSAVNAQIQGAVTGAVSPQEALELAGQEIEPLLAG
ncbi:MAG: sugar ABC transporter substrate-binding protein [Chloroflexota bacterium]|nr:sugar ABC transporter substrate-binding protein [Chloroflexota bacterium]MDP9472436.1 sugar ABC transporter substrate-binding protein [Chloroflexota bacterium]